MALISAGFVGFVCAACLVVSLLPARVRYLWLLACSYGLYIWVCRGLPLQMPAVLTQLGLGPSMPAWVPALALLVAATLLSWLCGLLVGRCRAKPLRVLFLCVGIASCLGLWLGSRYLGILNNFRLYVGGIVTAESATGFVHIALPLGLSYYTVQAAGYVLDVYARRAAAEKNPLRYAAFVSFFPAIFMGPTARAAHLLPQLAHPMPFSYNRTSGGLFRMLWGFVKKLVVADNIAIFTADVLPFPAFQSGPLLAAAILLFAAQLYMDFSGCCDIVLGAARMLGIDHAENFSKPFSAVTFAGLWRRWFISFSGLLRDAILTPLQKTRLVKKGGLWAKASLVVGAVLTYTVLGLWHGLQREYLLWGVATGALVAGSLLLDGARETLAAAVPLYRKPVVRAVLRRVMVYLLFCASLTLFISAYYGPPFHEWISRLFGGWAVLTDGTLLPLLSGAGLTTKRTLVVAGGLCVVGLLEHIAISYESTMADWIRTQRFYVRWPLYYLLICALLLFGVFPAGQGMYQSF